MYYSTSSATDEFKKKMPNCFKFFDVCEKCKVNYLNTDKSIVFYKRYNKILCDECVDKNDGTWVYVNDREKTKDKYLVLDKKIIID